MPLSLDLAMTKLFPQLQKLKARLQPLNQIVDNITDPVRTDRATEFTFDFETDQKLPDISLRPDLTITVGVAGEAHGRLAIVPPDTEVPSWITETPWIASRGPIPPKTILVAAELRGLVSGAAGAKLPLGSAVVSGTIGVDGNAAVVLAAARSDEFKPGKTTLLELAGNFLQRIAWPSADVIPSLPPGSGVALDFKGTVKFSAAVSGGINYEFFKAFSVAELSPAVHAQVECLARASVSQTLGGHYSLIVNGEDRGTTRIRVTHGRRAAFAGELALDVKGDWEISNLPTSPWDLLDAMLGTDTDSIQRWLDVAADPRFQSWDAVEQELRTRFGKLAPALLEKYLGPQIAAGLERVQDLAGKASAQLQRLDDRRNRLLRKFSDAYDELEQRLGSLEDNLVGQGSGTLASWLGGITDDTWSLLSDLLGDEIDLLAVRQGAADLLRSKIDPLREQLQEQAKDIADNAARLVSDLVAATDLEKVQEILTTAQDANKVRELIDAKVEVLAETLFDETIAKVPAKEVGKLVKRLNDQAVKIKSVVSTIEERLREAYAGKFSLHAALALSRSKAVDALMDVEFVPGGTGAAVTVYGAALKGDFGELASARPIAGVFINAASWQRTLQQQARLTFRGFGLDFLSVHSLEQLSKLELGAGGAFYAFSSTTSAAHLRQSAHESFSTAMVFQAAAQLTRTEDGGNSATNTYALKTLPELSLETTVSYDDRATTRAELEDYLEYAEATGLIESASDLADELLRDFPDVKRTAVRYRTFIAAPALRDFFSRRSDGEIADAVRAALRPIYIATHRRNRHRSNFALDLDTYQQLRSVSKALQPHGGWRYSLTYLDGHTAIATSAKSVDWEVFDLWLDGEREAGDALTRVDRAVDELRANSLWTPQTAAKQFAELDRAVERLLALGSGSGWFGLPRLRNPWRDNTFFVLLDALLRSATQAQQDTPQSLILELYGASDDAPALRRLIPRAATA